MIALLSGAWWAQKLAGVTAQAVGIAVAVALVVGGVWWLRHDARMDERRAWEIRLTAAKLQAALKAREIEKRSQAIATQQAGVWQEALAASEAARAEAEAKLATRARVICYPKEIVRALNK